MLFQLGAGATGKVGIGSTKPATTLDVKGAATVRGAFGLPPQATAAQNGRSVSGGFSFASGIRHKGGRDCRNQASTIIENWPSAVNAL